MKKKTHAGAAMIEAYEEAGVVGRAIGRRPIGTYRYIKDAASGGTVLMRVDVYMMQVSQQLVDWPEKGERDAQWLPPIEAAGLVTEKALGKIIRKVPALCRRKLARNLGLENIEQNGVGTGVRMRNPQQGVDFGTGRANRRGLTSPGT